MQEAMQLQLCWTENRNFDAMRRVIVSKGHQCAVYQTETLLLQCRVTDCLIVLCIIAKVVRSTVYHFYPGE